MSRVIVVGGGLSGLSAAHMSIQQGLNVTLIERNPFCGGNSTKATSGINGTPTQAQKANNINDSQEVFLRDVVKSANKGKEGGVATELQKILVADSGDAIEWLIKDFGIDLSIVALMGGHSNPRCHRGKEKFPGMTITYGLMEKFEKIEADTKGERAKLINKARVTELLYENGQVVGVKYERNKQMHEERGVVVIATGGYGADFSENSLLKKFRPDLLDFSTTNGDHCRGDGIKMAQKLGSAVIDMEYVQVHPTGMVSEKDPNNKVKFLAAEAMRGTGAIIVNGNGERFLNEIGTRDYCSEQMMKNKGPFKLILNSKASQLLEWHCKHYVGRNLMQRHENGASLAKSLGITPEKLKDTLNKYNEAAKAGKDEFGKHMFPNGPFNYDELFHVCQVTPVIHYCMGGIKINPQNQVLNEKGEWVKGLWAVGETCGGVHGKNRLGGNSLLDCVVHGRQAGRDIAKWAKGNTQASQSTTGSGTRVEEIASQMNASQSSGSGEFTADEVAKHNSETDCWVMLYGEVYDVTTFLDDHPGGKDSIMLYAGKDATEQFDMLHQKAVLEKYAKGLHKGKAKL